MRNLTIDDFSGKIGTSYEVLINGGAVPVKLAEFQPLPSAGREGGSFRLEFLGPIDPVVPQGVHRFRRKDDVVEIFMVPISRTPEGTRYEAIFF